MAQPKEINVAKDVVEKYEPKDIIHYVTKKLKFYNREGDVEKGEYRCADQELQMYIDILIELDAKMNGEKTTIIL